MTRSLLVSLALAVALLSLPAACGGGDATLEETVTGVPATFRALAEKAQEATYRMDYKVFGQAGASQEEGTLYRKPPNLRIDRLLAPEATPVSTTIWRDDEVIECDKPEGGEWRCVASPSEGQVTGLPLVITNPQDFNITGREGRILAGQETACFLAVPTGQIMPPFPEEFEVCFSEEGALLFQRTRSRVPGGAEGTSGPYIETTRAATTYSTQVDDDDFDPPAEPLGGP